MSELKVDAKDPATFATSPFIQPIESFIRPKGLCVTGVIAGNNPSSWISLLLSEP